MNLDEVKKRLEVACKNIASIGDSSEFVKNNPDKWVHLVQDVIQNYNYIRANATPDDDFIVIDAMADIIEIADLNPSLKNVVDSILSTNKNNPNNEKVEGKDPQGLANTIESLITEIRSFNGFDPEKMSDLQWALEECKKKLIDQKADFSPNAFDYLTTEVERELDYLNRAYETLEHINARMNL